MILRRLPAIFWLALGLLVTTAIYAPGLDGPWLFDDYPNIVDNPGVHIQHWSLADVSRAILASPASEFKRPLASLSFGINYLLSGDDPHAMKVTNLVIHLLNGIAAFFFLRALFTLLHAQERREDGYWAAAISTGWLVMPINLTAVLYVVQRMESMANLAVLLGLWGYVAGRRRMLDARQGSWLAFGSVLAGTALGLLAKETAVLAPLYAAIVELVTLGARRSRTEGSRRDWRVVTFFAMVLALPFAAGLAWLLPHVLDPATWHTRDFTLRTRLLSEARIITDYIGWTLLPTPGALSFYHDDFVISQGWLQPVSTLPSALCLAGLVVVAAWSNRRAPLVGLGIALYLACHTLTGTVLPLELVYEHRNYFASLGWCIALAGLIQAIPVRRVLARRAAMAALALLGMGWAGLTWATSMGWSDSLRLAELLASRAPNSPRAQYELGRMYIIASRYDRASRYAKLAYAPLERAASFPGASILPEQALIFMNARMGIAIEDTWWASMITKLTHQPVTVQDESSLAALSDCLNAGDCAFDQQRLKEALVAAISHDETTARLKSIYATFAWRTLGDRALAFSMGTKAVQQAPDEPAYRVTLARYAMAMNRSGEVRTQAAALRRLNVGGRLQGELNELDQWIRRHCDRSMRESDPACPRSLTP